MKVRRVRIIVVAVIVTIIGIGCSIWGGVWHNGSKDWIVKRGDIKGVCYFEKGINPNNMCLILNQNSHYCQTIKSGYICVGDFKYKSGDLYGAATEVDNVNYKFYDLSTKKCIGEVDLTEIVNEYLKQGFTWQPSVSIVYGIDDKESAYAKFHLKKIDKNASPTKTVITVYVNLYTGGVEEYEEFLIDNTAIGESERIVEKKYAYNKSLNIVDWEDEIGLLKANGFTEGDISGFSVTAVDEVSVLVKVRRGMLPKENERLYAEFPGLKEYNGKEDDFVFIYMDSYLTAEEILSMLLEEGQEISFRGCILPAELSIDGKEHEINSFEDYYQWKEWD